MVTRERTVRTGSRLRASNRRGTAENLPGATELRRRDRLACRQDAAVDAEADLHLGRFPNAEKGYEAITAKVSEYVTRERQLAGSPNRTVDRSQLYVAANQASLNTDQMHYQGQSLQSSLDTNSLRWCVR